MKILEYMVKYSLLYYIRVIYDYESHTGITNKEEVFPVHMLCNPGIIGHP